MTRTNTFDEARQRMAAEYGHMRDSLKKQYEEAPPYNSTKLSPEEEAHAYANPDWLYPPRTRPDLYENLPPGLTPEQIQQEVFRRCRIASKQDMGAAEYLAFLKRNAGIA